MQQQFVNMGQSIQHQQPVPYPAAATSTPTASAAAPSPAPTSVQAHEGTPSSTSAAVPHVREARNTLVTAASSGDSEDGGDEGPDGVKLEPIPTFSTDVDVLMKAIQTKLPAPATSAPSEPVVPVVSRDGMAVAISLLLLTACASYVDTVC